MQHQDHLFRSCRTGVHDWASQTILYHDNRFESINNWSTIDDDENSPGLHDHSTVQQGLHSARGTWNVLKETEQGVELELHPEKEWEVARLLLVGGFKEPKELVLLYGERKDHSECFVKERVPLAYSFSSASCNNDTKLNIQGYNDPNGLYLVRKDSKLSTIKLFSDKDTGYANALEIWYSNEECVVAGSVVNLNQPQIFTLQENERILQVTARYFHDSLVRLSFDTNLRSIALGHRKGDRKESYPVPNGFYLQGFSTCIQNDKISKIGIVSTESSTPGTPLSPRSHGSEFDIKPNDQERILEIFCSGGAPISGIGFKYSAKKIPICVNRTNLVARILPGEWITELHARYENEEIVYLGFVTNLNRLVQFGCTTWKEDEMVSIVQVAENQEIIGLHGKGGEFLNCIDAYVRSRQDGKINLVQSKMISEPPSIAKYKLVDVKNRGVKKQVLTEGIAGPQTGEHFEFEPPTAESRISFIDVVHFKYAHTSLGVQYDEGDVKTVGKIAPNSTIGLKLEPNEHVVEARGIFNSAKIPYLVLTTDFGNVIESGYDYGEKEFDFTVADGEEIIGFHGTANSSEIVSIGIKTRKIANFAQEAQ
jgi:hypothetical protein